MRRSNGFLHILTLEIYDSGRELITASISARAVVSSSTEKWALPITFFRQRFVDVTILSNALPHHGLVPH